MAQRSSSNFRNSNTTNGRRDQRGGRQQHGRSNRNNGSFYPSAFTKGLQAVVTFSQMYLPNGEVGLAAVTGNGRFIVPGTFKNDAGDVWAFEPEPEVQYAVSIMPSGNVDTALPREPNKVGRAWKLVPPPPPAPAVIVELPVHVHNGRLAFWHDDTLGFIDKAHAHLAKDGQTHRLSLFKSGGRDTWYAYVLLSSTPKLAPAKAAHKAAVPPPAPEAEPKLQIPLPEQLDDQTLVVVRSFLRKPGVNLLNSIDDARPRDVTRSVYAVLTNNGAGVAVTSNDGVNAIKRKASRIIAYLKETMTDDLTIENLDTLGYLNAVYVARNRAIKAVQASRRVEGDATSGGASAETEPEAAVQVEAPKADVETAPVEVPSPPAAQQTAAQPKRTAKRKRGGARNGANGVVARMTGIAQDSAPADSAAATDARGSGFGATLGDVLRGTKFAALVASVGTLDVSVLASSGTPRRDVDATEDEGDGEVEPVDGYEIDPASAD